MKIRKSLITAAVFSLLAPAATVLVDSASAGVYQQDEKKKPTRNRQEDRRNDRGGRNGGSNDDDENEDMRFAGMDRNRDGQITRSEWRGNDRSFAQHDWNGDGVL
ncbi:MAG TPA: hypothetical protein VG477_01400, partial [Thermoanaerobaculia bacterium]|nr:hypothetical protein [Thermoanaerobaculia bacterium]